MNLFISPLTNESKWLMTIRRQGRNGDIVVLRMPLSSLHIFGKKPKPKPIQLYCIQLEYNIRMRLVMHYCVWLDEIIDELKWSFYWNNLLKFFLKFELNLIQFFEWVPINIERHMFPSICLLSFYSSLFIFSFFFKYSIWVGIESNNCCPSLADICFYWRRFLFVMDSYLKQSE